MPSVIVKFFGPARDLAGCVSMNLDIVAGDTLGVLAGKLAGAVPALADTTGLRLAVNRAYVPLNHVLGPGDEIAVIPPVSGGSDGPVIALTRERIAVEEIITRLQIPEGGAIATFVGMVRSEKKDTVPLAALEYHAYEEMALSQMHDIRERGIQKFGLLDAVLVHRLGRVGLTKASIVVACVSAHRGAAFDACRWIVDAIKTDVPIWKKDIWADESSGWTHATA
jgi:molybdopterin synthase catalytic subunit/molybdopterin converting factor small subunit